MFLNSPRQQLAAALAAGLLIGVPAALRPTPDQTAAPKRSATETRLANLEATSKKLVEAVGTLAKLSEEQGKSLEEVDLRLTRVDKQLGDFADRSALKGLGTTVASLKNDVDLLRAQQDEIDRLKRSTSSLSDDLQRLSGQSDDLRRKVESASTSDLERKIDSLRGEVDRVRDRQGELDRIGSKHEDRLNKLESKG
jgi:predicted nuclease with TOPRIM domain